MQPGPFYDSIAQPSAVPKPEGEGKDAEQEGNDESEKLCGVCLKSAPRYTCPACGTRSCSLPCTTDHKAASGCTGKRSRTGFVRLGEFGERELVSDFRFLEEAALLGEAARRTRRRLEKGGANSAGALGFMLRQTQLRNMRWGILPASAERRLANTSCFDRQKRRLLWRVEWRFEAANFTAVDERVDEATRLVDALNVHLKPLSGQAERHQLLREYLEAGTDKLALLMRIEHRPADSPAYHHLMTSHTLRLALAQKTVIEFPIICVLLQRQLPQYTVLKPGQK